MPNAQLIQQRTFAGGMDDFTPPDTLKEDACISMVNFLPGDDAVPLPVRGGTVRHAFLGDDPVTGIHTFRRANGDDFVVAGVGDTLHSVDADSAPEIVAAYTDERITYSSGEDVCDFEDEGSYLDGWVEFDSFEAWGAERSDEQVYAGTHSLKFWTDVSVGGKRLYRFIESPTGENEFYLYAPSGGQWYFDLWHESDNTYISPTFRPRRRVVSVSTDTSGDFLVRHSAGQGESYVSMFGIWDRWFKVSWTFDPILGTSFYFDDELVCTAYIESYYGNPANVPATILCVDGGAGATGTNLYLDGYRSAGSHWWAWTPSNGAFTVMRTETDGATATFSVTCAEGQVISPYVRGAADIDLAIGDGAPVTGINTSPPSYPTPWYPGGIEAVETGAQDIVLTVDASGDRYRYFLLDGFFVESVGKVRELHTFSDSGRDLSFAVNNDTLYIANGADPLLKWSGREVGDATQDGDGLDDLTAGGSYTGTTPQEYVVEITATGTPDTLKWSDDGGETYTTGVSITSGDITLSDGVTISFGATTGHTLGDSWTFWAGKAVECENAPVARYVISFRDRLWVSDGTSRVWFSAPLDDSNWSGNELDDGGSLYIARDDGSVVTGLARMFNGVVVFKESDTYLWSYGDADNPGFSGQIDLLIPGVGCASHASIAYYAGSVIFLGTSSNGSYAVYRLQGEGIDEISIRIPQRLSDVLVMSQRAPCAVIYDHRYYLASDDPSTGEQVRTVLYVHDMRRQGWTEFRGLTVGALSDAPSPDYILVGSGINGCIYRYPAGHTDDGDAIAYSFESRPFAPKNVFQDNRWRNVYADLEGTSLGSVRIGYAVDERDPEYQTFPLSSAGYVFYDDPDVFYDGGAVYGVGDALIKARMPVDTASARGSTCKVFLEGETTQPLRVQRIAVAFRPRKTRYGG